MAKILQFPSKDKQKKDLEKEVRKILESEGLPLEWMDNKLEKLMEDIQNLPTDEEELINALAILHSLEQIIFESMRDHDYEKFFHIRVNVEKVLKDVNTGAYKHGSED